MPVYKFGPDFVDACIYLSNSKITKTQAEGFKSFEDIEIAVQHTNGMAEFLIPKLYPFLEMISDKGERYMLHYDPYFVLKPKTHDNPYIGLDD